MSKSGKSPYRRVAYDTPTDGISRKKFDRAMDTHIRRYVKLAGRVAAIEKQLRSYRSAFQDVEEE